MIVSSGGWLMKTSLPAVLFAALMILLPSVAISGKTLEKNHDYIPKFHNVIFIFDVSDSMTAGFPQNFDHSRLFVATRAFQMFNALMPHIPRWQYDVNSALITYGDSKTPQLLGPLGPWTRNKYAPLFPCLRRETFLPCTTAGLPEALQLAGSMICQSTGRTAIVVFTDGGRMGECPQKTATALKDTYGDRVEIYGVYVGSTEVGWRNLYEVCKLTGGYSRHWEEVRDKPLMKAFAWDITIREVMFPYPEIYFKPKSAELISSEALKLESVANFLNAIPQYVLQIDGHSNFIGNTDSNYGLALKRAQNVKDALVRIYHIHPSRVLVRSWGEELPRYDNHNPDLNMRNEQANLSLMLPLRNFPYDEKHLHTFGNVAVGDITNTQERDSEEEWASPVKPPPHSNRPPVAITPARSVGK